MSALRGKNTSQTVTRVSTVIWVLALPMILGFFALSNIDNAVEFRTLQTFFFLYLGSGMGILFAQANLGGTGERARDLNIFWTNDIDLKGLIWIGGGIFAIFVSVFLILIIASGGDADALRNAQFGGILVAGIIMMVAFLQTNALLVPIIIHGVYNSTVVYLNRTGFEIVGGTQQFAVAPDQPVLLGVNEIGIGFQGVSDLFSEFIWQFTLVATAEEFLKLAILVFVVILINGFFQSKGISVLIGAGVAIIFWTSLHLVNAI
ncbi:MAG: hypothetical protein KJI69_05355 [Patescibacteria group bacterium]|nr:hypothetical protein [Patescibacteria group bacterium]